MAEQFNVNNIWDFFARGLEVSADELFLICDGQRFTYSQIGVLINSVARSLIDDGLEQNDRVGIIGVNSVPSVVAMFGSQRAGGTTVPINFRFKGEELKFVLDNSRVRFLFIDSRYLPIVTPLLKELTNLKRIVVMGEASADVPEIACTYEEYLRRGENLSDAILTKNSPDSEGIIIYTSGTTGRPKGAINSQSYWVEAVASPDKIKMVKTIQAVMSPPYTGSVIIPLFHVGGFGNLFISTIHGDPIFMLPQFDAGKFIEGVEQEQVRTVWMVPTMLKQVLDHPSFSRERLKSLVLIVYGGAPMPPALLKRTVKELPKMYLNMYGQTETGTVTQLSYQDHIISGTPEEKALKMKRLGSVGQAVDDLEIKIVNENGSPLDVGEVGEIIVRSKNMMKGYLGVRESDPAHPIKDGWCYTGDMGYLDEGGYLYISGRRKDMIIRGGENISPEEIENVIHDMEGVAEVAIIGIPDEEWGERIMAVVAMEPGHETTLGDLQAHCVEHLANYKKPVQVAFVDELPRNPIGKVLKKDLRIQYGGQKV